MAFGIDDIIGAGLKILDKVIPDPAAKAAAQQEWLRMEQAERLAVLGAEQAQAQGQIDVNKAEAASGSTFVGGWRPFIGWICGAALLYKFLLAPIGYWFAVMAGHPEWLPPVLDAQIWELVLGMLGLGGLRTYEKMKGVAR